MKAAISSRSALILIVIAQFLCTSLWFAGNVVVPELSVFLEMPNILAPLTSMVQFGFIAGTLVFAIFSIPDRFAPVEVFFFSAILAACCNILILMLPMNLGMVLSSRFLVGFFLAGIYPVGMKIASDYFEKGLGTALGFLVGALVLGTAFPHLIKGLGIDFSWKIVLWTTSILAVVGGTLVGFFVPDGPFRKQNMKFDSTLIPSLAKIKELKSAASGYFGHMWELYTFWAFVPLLIGFLRGKELGGPEESLLSFWVIAVGGISCAVGGWIAQKRGSRTVAQIALLGSGICCLILPGIGLAAEWIWILFLVIWGMLITADSPQFSTLVAQSVSAEYRGTALTLVNSIGFAISIVSIQAGQFLLNWFPVDIMLSLLVIGPLFGLGFFRWFHSRRYVTS